MSDWHVVFDCDGTLIDSTSTVIDGIGYAITEVTGKTYDRKELERFYSADFSKLMDTFGLDKTDLELRQKLLYTWSDYAKKHHGELPLFDGIVQLLEQLQDEGCILHVWTARDRSSTLQLLKHNNVARYFHEIVCGDDGPTKPHPWGLEKIFGAGNNSNSVVIGDSDTDLLGSIDFGTQFLGAGWCALSNTGLLESLGAGTILTDVNEAAEAILRLRDKNV